MYYFIFYFFCAENKCCCCCKKRNRVKNANWREADQLAIYKCDREVKLGSTKKEHRSTPALLPFKGQVTVQRTRNNNNNIYLYNKKKVKDKVIH